MVIPKRFRRQIFRERAVTVSRLILECLAEFGTATLDVFFPAKYPEARLWRHLLGLDESYRFKRETFSSLLSRLRAQGLIARSGKRPESRWRLTVRGAAHLKAVRKEPALPRRDGVRRLVIFDIPERERKKRAAIRAELAAAGFMQFQKSVWMGDRPLPEDFMMLVDALALGSAVHIFSVRETGTLRGAQMPI